MISTGTDDDDSKRHLNKKKELNLQPISSSASNNDDSDLAAIAKRLEELAETTSEKDSRQHALILPPQQDAPFAEAMIEKDKPHSSAAVNIVRSKIEKLYGTEPDADEEAVEAYQAGNHRSKHQQYMYDLTNSGKSLADIQVEWHKYYASLPDDEKHDVWQEFYAAHSSGAAHAAASPKTTDEVNEKVIGANWKAREKSDTRTVAEIKHQVMRRAAPKGVKMSTRHHVQSLLFGIGIASLFLLVSLFGFFNERILAPFMRPSSQVSATPIVGTSGDIGKDQIIIIPKINLEVPVVYGNGSTDEQTIQDSLNDGVVHYSTSADPGQNGNVVIVGHSSNNILNKGKYKFAFVLLKRLEIGDTFSLNKGGTRYTYQIYDKKIVKPTDVSVLGTAAKENSATLITCDPPGTSINRLVVVGQQISPDPAGNPAAPTAAPELQNSGILPGNSVSLWERIKSWF